MEQQLQALEKIGGIPALGSYKTDNMFHAGWAWAGSTPLKSTKLVAAHFGGTRNPMVISWPKKIKADNKNRQQFHHVNDIVPTIYEIVGVKAPKEVAGITQDPLDGVSLAYTFDQPEALTRKEVQYFENNASRGIYHKGWYACTFGPFVPWDTPSTVERLKKWDAEKDVWELYQLDDDFSQAKDLSEKFPEKLQELKDLFLEQARSNKVLPIGGGLWTRFHPEDVIRSPYRKWSFDEFTERMPEFAAPPLGKRSNQVRLMVETKKEDQGVLYALGGSSGGVCLYLKDGKLTYEYNMLILQRTEATTSGSLEPGKHEISVTESIAKPGAPAEVVVTLDGKQVIATTVPHTVPGAFTASETLDVGVDLGARVSEKFPREQSNRFTGKMIEMTVELK
jgi:arylsulfatase